MTIDKASRNHVSAAPGPPGGSANRLSVRIAHDIGVAIASGQYGPGDTLPGEVEICERLHVSRTAYREAIRMLTSKGMVETRQRTGTRVQPRDQWHLLDPDIVAWSFVVAPPVDYVRSLFELRLIIEPEAASLAALRKTPRDLARMGYALEQMERFDLGSPEGREADQSFHHTILQAANNELLGALSATVRASVGYVTEFKSRRDKLARDARPDHHRIFAGIAAGAPEEARAAMAEHIRLGMEETFSAIESAAAEAALNASAG
jgi:DNA-binding FadR family transcriptional regulator